MGSEGRCLGGAKGGETGLQRTGGSQGFPSASRPASCAARRRITGPSSHISGRGETGVTHQGYTPAPDAGPVPGSVAITPFNSPVLKSSFIPLKQAVGVGIRKPPGTGSAGRGTARGQGVRHERDQTSPAIAVQGSIPTCARRRPPSRSCRCSGSMSSMADGGFG